MAPAELRLGAFESVLLTGSDERHLQAQVQSTDAQPTLVILAPVNASGRIRAIAIRWRQPGDDDEPVDPQRPAGALELLIRSTMAIDQGLTDSDCVVDAFGSFHSEQDFEGIDRRAFVADQGLAYRLLDVDSVVWFTASRAAS